MAGIAEGGVLPLGLGTENLGSQLPRLTMETELHKLLSEEKARAENHKINYQQLKIEHMRLQENIIELEAENKSTIEESRIVKDKYLTMYDACKTDLAERIAEVEEMKSKMITPQRLEVIKASIIDEVEQVYRERTKKQETEVEDYRSALSKVRYELSFLKAEYEHNKTDYQQQMEDMARTQDIELKNLREDRDTAIQKIQAETGQDMQRVRGLQRENAQLHLQLKEVLLELEESRALKEKTSLDGDSVSRVQSRTITEHAATIRSLEAERESLKRQVESTQRELTASGMEHNKLQGHVHELGRKNTLLKGHAEEVIHRSKVDLSDLKMEMLKQKGEVEKEKDRLSNEVEDLRSQLDIAETKVRQLQAALEDKERESVQRVQSAREDEFSKMAAVENEKFELETKLQELERRRIDEEGRRAADTEKANDRVSAAQQSKDQAERELIGVKTRLSHMESLQDQLERERSENSALKSRVHKLETELSSFTSAEHDLTDSNLKLKNSAALLREELKLTQSQLDKLQNNHEIILLQQRQAVNEDRAQMEVRVHELEDKLGQSQVKYTRASAIHKKLKKQTVRKTDHYKDKLMLLEAQNAELDLEKQALQKCVPPDQYNRLRKQWKELWRRHQEFRTILFSVTCAFPESIKKGEYFPYRKSSPSGPLDASAMLNHSNFDNELEEQHQDDLRVLRTRLETLDQVQHKQLAELNADLTPELTPREKRDLEKDIRDSPNLRVDFKLDTKLDEGCMSDEQVSLHSLEA